MNAHTTNADTLKAALKKAIKSAVKSERISPTISAVRSVLIEAQEALRESGFQDAVLELRIGVKTDYGLRYTAYLRSERFTFETLLFSVFDDDATFAFQAEGQIETSFDGSALLDRVRVYLLEPHVVEVMTGMLRQFGAVGQLTRV